MRALAARHRRNTSTSKLARVQFIVVLRLACRRAGPHSMKQAPWAEKSKRQTRVRPVRLRISRASVERRSDGAIIIRPDEPLGPYPRVLTERLIRWARVAPDSTLAAKRGANGGWRYLTY